MTSKEREMNLNVSLSNYIRHLRVSDIVILSSTWREETGGYQVEHIVDELICRKGGKPHRMKVHWVQKAFPRLDLSCGVDEDVVISETEYEDLCHRHGGILDTATYYEKLAKRSETERQLKETVPLCPKCQAPMEERSGRFGDFWGCPRYPECDGTRKLVASVRSRRSDLWDQLEEYRSL